MSRKMKRIYALEPHFQDIARWPQYIIDSILQVDDFPKQISKGRRKELVNILLEDEKVCQWLNVPPEPSSIDYLKLVNVAALYIMDRGFVAREYRRAQRNSPNV